MRENKKPLVSVLMGVCYRRKDLGLLKRSVESVLNQTFTNFELLICDGGSSDEAIHLLDSLANDDHRIQLVRDNRIPTDLAHKLNVCLHYARGDLIARMDDDDFSAPERFERQVQYLESHPDIAFVGCNVIQKINTVYCVRTMICCCDFTSRDLKEPICKNGSLTIWYCQILI